MNLQEREIRQMILIAMAVMVIPMVVFPGKLGLPLIEFSLLQLGLELVIYSAAVLLINRKLDFGRNIISAFLCLGARHLLGLLFGLLIFIMYPLKLSVAISFGVVSYLPSIILQVLTIPLILYPLIKKFGNINDEDDVPDFSQTEKYKRAVNQNVTQEYSSNSFIVSNEKNINSSQPDEWQEWESPKPRQSTASGDKPVNGFDKVVNYIGEAGTVLMVAVVDKEGLMLSGFKRVEVNLEDWTPLAFSLLEKNTPVLDKMGLPHPEKLEMMFDDKRLVAAFENGYSLLVVSERTVDDLVNVRINQGLEMLKNYVAERYGKIPAGNAERIYV